MSGKLTLKDLLILSAALAGMLGAAVSYGASMNRLDTVTKQVESWQLRQQRIEFYLVRIGQKIGADFEPER